MKSLYDNFNFRFLIIQIVSILFILLFIYAAVSKLLDIDNFKNQMSQSPLITDFAEILSITTPLSEIVISILLFTDRWRLIGLYGSTALMMLFSAYIVAITQSSSYVPCSCGGVLQVLTWNQHLLFNVCFVLISAVTILSYPKQTKT